MSTLLLVARQELVLAARARSIQIFAAVFGVLALTVAGSGYVLTGGVGVQDFARTAASLLQLVLLMVPLMALLLGVVALSGERGSLELLFAQPLARGDILFGKLLGLLGALLGAESPAQSPPGLQGGSALGRSPWRSWSGSARSSSSTWLPSGSAPCSLQGSG